MKKIEIPFKFHTFNQGCLIACLEMVMNIQNPGFQIENFIKTLQKNKFGYDIQEIAEGLAKRGFDIEYGFYDRDILGKNFHNQPLLGKLEKVLDEKKIHPSMLSYLKATIGFVKKYPDQIKIEKPDLKILRNFIDQSIPIIVHLNAKSLGADIEEEVHAVIVSGYDETGFFIVNPPEIAEEHVIFENFQKFWREAGYYYLIIEKSQLSQKKLAP